MKPSTLLLLPLLVCLAAAAPRAVVLVGPHKTGSTYLQSQLITFSKRLRVFNYALIGGGSNKGLASFVSELRQGKEPARYQSMVANDFKKKNNIIMSSELFASLHEGPLRKLARILQGFDVSIVITYRDWLSLIRSFHEQLNKQKFSLTFGEFFLRSAGAEFDVRNLVDKFGSVFGRENLYVIDYNGVAAAGRDLFEVLVKEVLRLSMSLSPGPKVNVSPPNLLGAQMYRIMTQYAAVRYNCSYSAPPYNVKFPGIQMPTIVLGMLKLTEYSRYIDAEFREKYTEGVNLICGNRTATTSRVLRPIPEVDTNAVLQSVVWRAALDAELHKRNFSKSCK